MTANAPLKLEQNPADELLRGLGRRRLDAMVAAANEVYECYRVLGKANANVVGELLRGQGTFYEWDHYPKGDIYDDETHGQHYYHAHRGEHGEHGHFHTFLRAKGMPPNLKPLPLEREVEWPKGDDAIAHLVAISMDKFGYPTHLFTTNRWVTGETWYRADDVIAMLPRFAIDHAYPSWPTNRWVTAMIALFRPQIEFLVRRRDEEVARRQASAGEDDLLEDRDFEVASMMEINVDSQADAIEAALKALA